MAERFARQPASRREVQVRVAVLGSLASVAVVVLLVLYWLSVRTRSGQRLEEASRRARDVVPDDIISGAWTLIDTVSVASLVIVTATVTLIAILRNRPRLAITVGAAVLAANVATQLLKRELLSRPDIVGAGDSNSYPSGHATVAMSVLLALVLVVPQRWRSVVGVAGLVYPIGVGIAVVTSGWHRPSDVVGGWMVCLAVFAAATTVLIAASGYGTGGRRWPATTEAAALAMVMSAILLVIGVTGLSRAARWIDDGSVRGLDEALIVMAFSAAITAGAVATLASLLLALRGVSLDRPWRGTNVTPAPSADRADPVAQGAV